MSKNQAENAAQAAKAINLREKLIALPKVMQEAIANYFNMYNCAAWLYNDILTPDAKEYVDLSIQFARELNDLQNMPDATDLVEQEQIVKDLNHGK